MPFRRLGLGLRHLRYERKKIVRLVGQDANDDRRALRAVYADLREDRAFYVTVGTKERRRIPVPAVGRLAPDRVERLRRAGVS